MPWLCGKCGSAGLYRDKDFQIGDFCIVCPLCGNRYYADNGRLSSGVQPVWEDTAKKTATIEYLPSHRGKGQGEGAAPSGAPPEKRIGKGETAMKKERKRACANCKRVRHIIGADMCWICYKCAKGLEDDERAAALAEIKAKIESGAIGQGKGKRRRKATVAIAPSGGETKPMSPEAIAEVKRRVTALGEKRDGRLTLADLTSPQQIPVTIRLTIEVGIRLVGVQG